MLTTTSLPLIFTDADVQSVARAHANNTADVKFGGASVVFRSVDDLPRVQVIVANLAALDVASSSGVLEVEFRDRRTRFVSGDELRAERAKQLSALTAYRAAVEGATASRRSSIKVRYVNYKRGY
ncbi:hypothetical protein [Ephemeroptericola cinctiostellae]|nr:hypothetical protein [Ephemeroptericola cinctiostellae]